MAWFDRLKGALTNTSQRIKENIDNIFYKTHIDEADLISLENSLLAADIGLNATDKILQIIKKCKFNNSYSKEEVESELIKLLAEIAQPGEQPLLLSQSNKPNVVLVCGVNGNGKTTTIGKLATYFSNTQQAKVMIAAADTFRAAATEQLAIWADRVGCEIVKGNLGEDAASVSYKALDLARQCQMDLLLIDTAGRLHNYSNLMDELAKISKVLSKQDSSAPHHVLLVIDATTGQNAINQVLAFQKVVNLTGIVVTKLDGTAKGGVLLNIIDRFKLPVHFIGIGEGASDLRPFIATEFAQALLK